MAAVSVASRRNCLIRAPQTPLDVSSHNYESYINHAAQISAERPHPPLTTLASRTMRAITTHTGTCCKAHSTTRSSWQVTNPGICIRLYMQPQHVDNSQGRKIEGIDQPGPACARRAHGTQPASAASESDGPSCQQEAES